MLQKVLDFLQEDRRNVAGAALVFAAICFAYAAWASILRREADRNSERQISAMHRKFT